MLRTSNLAIQHKHSLNNLPLSLRLREKRRFKLTTLLPSIPRNFCSLSLYPPLCFSLLSQMHKFLARSDFAQPITYDMVSADFICSQCLNNCLCTRLFTLAFSCQKLAATEDTETPTRLAWDITGNNNHFFKRSRTKTIPKETLLSRTPSSQQELKNIPVFKAEASLEELICPCSLAASVLWVNIMLE